MTVDEAIDAPDFFLPAFSATDAGFVTPVAAGKAMSPVIVTWLLAPIAAALRIDRSGAGTPCATIVDLSLRSPAKTSEHASNGPRLTYDPPAKAEGRKELAFPCALQLMAASSV